MASSLGLEKPFNPSPVDKALLEEAVQVEVAYVRSDMATPRAEEAYVYEEIPNGLIPSLGEVAMSGLSMAARGRNLDARNNFFWAYTVNTPAMVLEMVGVGSQYAIAGTDSKMVNCSGWWQILQVDDRPESPCQGFLVDRGL